MDEVFVHCFIRWMLSVCGALGDNQQRTYHPKAKLGLGVPIGSAKPQLGELICGDIVRDFRGQSISTLVDSL